MSLELLLNRETGTLDLHDLNNCSHSLVSRAEDFVVNTHADYLIPADRLHDPNYFPFLHQFRALGSESARHALGRLYSLIGAWPEHRRTLELYLNGRLDLFVNAAETSIGDTRPIRSDLRGMARAQFWEMLYYLSVLLLDPTAERHNRNVQELILSLRRRKNRRLAEYWSYVRDAHDEHFGVIAFDALSAVLDDIGFLRPLILARFAGVQPEQFGSTPLPTASAFRHLRRVYGDIFEAVGDLALHFTSVNNLRLRGAFDRFKTFTLERYLNSDKAARLRPFESYKRLASIVTPYYDNRLRNGSHHGRMKFDRSSGLIRYWPQRGVVAAATAVEMPLWDYLARCYDLVQALGILISLHHGLETIYGPQD